MDKLSDLDSIRRTLDRFRHSTNEEWISIFQAMNGELLVPAVVIGGCVGRRVERVSLR